MKPGDLVYEKNPMGQVIYNIWREHNFSPRFFRKAEKDEKFRAEIEKEWARLERREKRGGAK
jgi:hypothetical protein